MFTGIVTETGEVLDIRREGDWTIRIAAQATRRDLVPGASVACHGICLTVVALSQAGTSDWFEIQVSDFTANATNVHNWQRGSQINLERSLRVGDELGGHIVTGHIDGLATVRERISVSDSIRFRLACPSEFGRYLPAKASVALNGVSLTITEADDANDDSDGSGTDFVFGVNIIPHTRKVTGWGRTEVGDTLNLEIDPLARYVERLWSHHDT